MTIANATAADFVTPGEIHRLRTEREPRQLDDARVGRVPLDRAMLIANGIFGFEHLDVRARSFVLLRSQLLNRFHRPGGRVLAVTSTQPGNGKTYVAANAAAALSRIHPTVLIDLDLRRPTLARRFGLTPGHGVDDYLAGDVSWESTGSRIADTDLTIYGVREPRPDSAALLASERLGLMLDAIRALPGAPICIVDTPPILALDDIMLIAEKVDGVLMIVEEGRTKSADIRDALRLLSPTPIVGSILNKSLTAKGRRDGYEHYYDAP
ncbi:CpsD/CapB family tyrosine-protein kinase [Sphingomonas sp. SUN019]|uniref:CpsD/CapB family tyrosine-protein kinase n=1 Tax=Sphingomonas sp. SUN019 TaxID=2937788 RepID=UPI002164B944|nr:CpsD/CapB family tyrosine-protein kinase [Sphingomonas sp. SUN019]UVO51470.1 CpsD/CapB family tyrosine-protein kinase [Sphingomonas sp. SUN019]